MTNARANAFAADLCRCQEQTPFLVPAETPAVSALSAFARGVDEIEFPAEAEFAPGERERIEEGLARARTLVIAEEEQLELDQKPRPTSCALIVGEGELPAVRAWHGTFVEHSRHIDLATEVCGQARVVVVTHSPDEDADTLAAKVAAADSAANAGAEVLFIPAGAPAERPDPRVDLLGAFDVAQEPVSDFATEPDNADEVQLLIPAHLTMERVLHLIGRPRPLPQALGPVSSVITALPAGILNEPSKVLLRKRLNDKPVVVRTEVGLGAIWNIFAPLDAVGRAAVLRIACARARLVRDLPGLPPGVEGLRRGPTLVLINHTSRAVEIIGVTGTDLLGGGRATGHLVLAPRSGAIIV